MQFALHGSWLIMKWNEALSDEDSMPVTVEKAQDI
jgi:hypothetical protein